MLKLYFFIVVFLITSFSAFSQVKFGVKAGGNLSGATFRDIPDNAGFENPTMRLSYHVGGFSIIPVSERLSLLLEVLYNNKGFEIDQEGFEKANLHLHYINLPVLLNYEIIENLYLGIGPELGYLISAKSKFDDRTEDVDFLYSKKFDVGIDAGLEYRFMNFLTVGMRYNYGLTSVTDELQIADNDGNPIADSKLKLKNRVLQLYVGYTLNAGKH